MSAAPQHTPTPWRAIPETDYSRAAVAWNDRGDPVAEVFGRSREERRVNADLIAAAPELLSTLKDMLAAQVCTEDHCAQCEAARRVIAQAEGRASA